MFVLLLIIGLKAVAGSLESAAEAYHRGDYATAYRLFKPLAERGVPEAMASLGNMHASGYGVPEDLREAEKWWRKAAERGVITAMANMGTLYARGLGGVAQDWKEAGRWFHMAAERGHGPSMLTLSDMYVNGVGVEIDDVKACAWAGLAAVFIPEGELKERARDQYDAITLFISDEERERSRELFVELQKKIRAAMREAGR